jgi:hypothetical protein
VFLTALAGSNSDAQSSLSSSTQVENSPSVQTAIKDPDREKLAIALGVETIQQYLFLPNGEAHFEYSKAIGDGGIEFCNSIYRHTRYLQLLDCEYEYVSHSMGPANKRYLINLVWPFDAKGIPQSVEGRYLEKMKSDSSVVEDRVISSLKDNAIEEFSPAVAKLPEVPMRKAKSSEQ